MKTYRFVRYGKLKSTKQKGFASSDSFHSPPCGKGFYAFPFGYEELFLVGSLDNTQPKVIGCLPNITKYERSLWWNRVTEEYNDTIYQYEYKDIWKQKRVFNLKKDDLIWHHLKDTTKQKDIIKESKYWIYTTIEVWKKSLNKELNKNKMKTWKEFKQGDVRNYKNNGYYSKDHLEVFIDKKKI